MCCDTARVLVVTRSFRNRSPPVFLSVVFSMVINFLSRAIIKHVILIESLFQAFSSRNFTKQSNIEEKRIFSLER